MKAIKKTVAILLVALLTLCLMAGCQSSGGGADQNKISTLEEE